MKIDLNHLQLIDEKKFIQKNIQNSAGRYANHRIHGHALKPKEIVHGKGAHHKRGGIENIGGIRNGIRFNFRRRAKKAHQSVDVQVPCDQDSRAQDQRNEKAAGDIGFGRFRISPAQRAGKVRPASHSDHKGHRLEDGHGRKDHAYRR